jgi:hypothetical protein
MSTVSTLTLAKPFNADALPASRTVAVTFHPRLENSSAKPKPIPREAPMMRMSGMWGSLKHALRLEMEAANTAHKLGMSG